MSGSTTTHEATPTQVVASCFFAFRFSLLIGVIACGMVLSAIDAGDDCFWSAPGPGITFDEGLNTEGGVYFVEMGLQSGIGIVHPGTWYDIFNHPSYHPDYPPLGRLPGAVSNALLSRLAPAEGRPLYSVSYARVGTAIVFGLLAALVTFSTQRLCGPIAGLFAGLSLIFMPRVFGHAHLASVETMMNLTYAACVFGIVLLLGHRDQLRAKDGIWPGVLLGLALLTKIQAIFLPPLLTVWILWNWRKNGISTLLVLALTSFAVFLLGWPWLWSDPFSRFFQYFAQTTDRVTLYCYYFGQRYADKAVPWHYPFVMFAVTTPIVTLALGMNGLIFRQEPADKREPAPLVPLNGRGRQLLAGAIVLPLVVFAIPGVAVYDGERLFLVVWPIFALFVGIGAQRLYESARLRSGALVAGILTAVAILGEPGYSLLRIQPCYLSYYSPLIGGLSGAVKLGLEPTYWGDSLTPRFLQEMNDKLPKGAVVGVAPVLHPLYLESLKKDSPLRLRPDLQIVAFDDKQPQAPQYVFWVRRLGDPWDSLLNRDAETEMIGEVSRSGVPLAELLYRSTPWTAANAVNPPQN